MRRILFLLLLALPLSAQKWDFRFEVPFPQGQSLPRTMLEGTNQLVSGDLDTGNGAIISASHRLIRIGPVLRLDWGMEFSQWTASGTVEHIRPQYEPLSEVVRSGDIDAQNSRLKQTGIGLGINAQLWLPFTGLCGEIGAIQRIQRYSYTSGNAESDGTIGRTWLRVGMRWRLPFVAVHPYVTASYQQPINKDQPVKIKEAKDLADYFKAQGKGQEFERMWTFGVGITF